MAQYIAICNWSTYQHYKERNPPWIKLHRTLMTSPTWVMLDDAGRVLAVSLMMLAAAQGNKIPHDLDYLKKVCFLNSEPDLKTLTDCQFIEIIGVEEHAINPLANVGKVLDQRREEERREETQYREVCDEPPLDSDLIVKAIIELHPRAIKNARTEHAVVDALIRESKALGSDKFAADYLLNRTRIYRECTDKWPPGEKQMICSAVNWFSESKYTEDEQFWKREQDGKAEQRNSEIENAGAEAARILGIRAGNLQVLPGGARSDSVVTGRGGMGEVGEKHRVIEGSVRSVPLKPEV